MIEKGMVNQMMKKRICCVLLGVLCLLQLTSCGNKGAGDSTPQNTEVNVLKEMESANSNEALSAKYDKIAFRFTYTYADGSVDGRYCYQDGERHVNETDYNLQINENGDIYGFDYDLNQAYYCAFVGDAYAEFKYLNCGLAYYGLDPNEIILSQDEKDGIISLYTKMIWDKDSVDGYAGGSFFFEAGAVDHFEMSYKVDAQTYEIIEYIVFAVLSDGTKQAVTECERVLDPEKYVVDEQLKELVFGGEQRTLTITAYPGTAQETVYTQTTSKESSFQVYCPEGGQLYEDVECTKQFQGSSDKTVDVHLYYK